MAKILVVDDDPDFVEVMRTVLTVDGHTVVSASSSADGMRQLAREQPDLVILDVIMSTVLDGLTMSQSMADDPELRHVPIIMVTSIANTDYAALFPLSDYIHIDAFLSKPVNPRELRTKVDDLLTVVSVPA
ncbi:MAG: response regulator [Anaerolineae bacterium]